MTTIYTTSKWNNPEFLITLHEATTEETNPIQFQPFMDEQHSRAYELALVDTAENLSHKLFVTPSNSLFSNVNMVGGFHTQLLNAFQSKLPDFGDSFVNIDLDEDIRETVSFSVFETNAFHKLPGGFKCKMKKAGDEIMV